MRMLTADQKESCLERLKNAYQALKFHEELKAKTPGEGKMAQSAFGLTESALWKVAECLGLESEVKEQCEARSKESRDRAEKIRLLEKRIAESTHIADLKPNMQAVSRFIGKAWSNEGFKSAREISARESGAIEAILCVEPAFDLWDMDDEDDVELFEEKKREQFLAHGLETVSRGGGEYIYAKDCDANKEKIAAIIDRLFPGAEIWKWEAKKDADGFILSGAEVIFSDLSFLEGIANG